MGKVYYDLGFLATAEVVECSATELVGQYVGQTGPKTQKLLEKGLGKILFIDEAYRLAEGQFAKEAMDEIVDSITKPKFAQKLIIILAGYDADINRLMSINPGLTSRFPEALLFKGLEPDESVRLLTELLKVQKSKLRQKKTDLDMAVLEYPRNAFFQDLLDRFKTLSMLPNWANARDVQTIAKSIFGKTMKSAMASLGSLTVDEKTILAMIDAMIVEQMHRSQIPFADDHQLPSATATPIQARLENPTIASRKQPAQGGLSSQARQSSSPVPHHDTQTASDDTLRDANVTDEVWERLQQDKAAAQAKEQEYKQLLEQEAALQKSIAVANEQKTASTKEIVPEKATQPGADDEAKRRHEEARLRHELERRAHEAELEILRHKRQQEEERRRKEREAQKKLKDMGVCCMGYRWIKQALGYRCAGGSHYVSNDQLGLA